MEITVYPVKCGDCSILYNESKCILIDCGSDNSDSNLCSSEFAYNTIRQKTKSITDIMVSHFHKDHFNGMLLIPNDNHINTAYLPYSIIDGKTVYSEGIGRLLAVAPPQSWGLRLSKNIVELFDKLENIAENICFLKTGDSIEIGKNTIRVLWPDLATAEFDLGELPVKIIPEGLMKEFEANSFEPEIRTNTLTNIENRLASQFAEIVGPDNHELIRIAELFISSFDTYLLDLHENRSASFSNVDELYQQLNEQRILFRKKLDIKKLQYIKHFSRQQYHSLVTSLNATSIVCDCEEHFLFLGDVPISIIDHISPSFKQRYGLVKIQHHGTQRYFTPRTLIGKYNVISNGGYDRRKVSAGFIGRNKIICTNAHTYPPRFCSYYNQTGVCSLNCIKVHSAYTVRV